MSGATILTCPRCAGDMRTSERSGVVIDQCRECLGIFLDRGELEHLKAAEEASLEAAGWSPPAPGTAQGGRPPARTFLEELLA